MKPLLVHLHIYYTEMWPEMREKLTSVAPYPHDLYVTLVEENKELQSAILAYKKDANIEVLENRGFDVGPFVHVINQVNLDDYSYVVKLHTKRNIDDKSIHVNHFSMYGTKWKDYLLEFLSSKEVFDKHLNILENNKNIGMLANFRIIVNSTFASTKTRKLLQEFYSSYGLPTREYKFIAGTMFLAKAHIFKQLQDMKLTINNFELVEAKIRHRQLAHKVERLFGLLNYVNDYSIVDPFTSKCEQNRLKFLVKLKNFLYQDGHTSSGKRIIKLCKIPVYRKKIK